MSACHAYLIAVGSNLGDREELIAKAKAAIITHIGRVSSTASLYETEPVGAANQLFLNSALICESELDPESVLEQLLCIEQQLGRIRRERWGNRAIDLDILLWRPPYTKVATQSYMTSNLCIPHPRMLERDFALVPAAEIAGSWVHPLTGQSLSAEQQQRRFNLPFFKPSIWIPRQKPASPSMSIVR